MSIVDHLFVDSLRRSQWLPPDRLQRYQRPLLERLLRHAASEAPFYAERLRPLFRGDDPQTAPIDLTRWHDIPILTRPEAFNHEETMKARTVPRDTGDIVSGQSSGSTGIPLKHVRSTLADTAANCQLDRVYELFGFDVFGSMAYIGVDYEHDFPYPHGRKASGWNRTSPAADLFLLDIRTDPKDQLEWLARTRPDYVFTYPNNLRSIAEIASRSATPRLPLRGVVASGEALTPEVRALISDTFECRVIDVYGAREIGQIAFECPDGDKSHFYAEGVVCEIVDGQGKPVRPGEMGSVVVTPLYNFAMPFIRYNIGDFAFASAAPCPCGRGLPSLEKVTGRFRNLFVMPDGKRRWPAFQPALLNARQLQVVQIDTFHLEVRIVPLDPASLPDSSAFVAHLKQILHPELQVTIVPVEKIDRNAGEKYEDFISLVA